MPIERKLAAIIFTDIGGYMVLSVKDETKALKLLDIKNGFSLLIEEFGEKFLSYPIPKALVEEWEKVRE